jgi:predicted methyltransferase
VRQRSSLRPGTVRARRAGSRLPLRSLAGSCAVLSAVLSLEAAAADPAPPADTARAVAFAGIEPGASVADFLPTSGDLVRLLCRAVGDSGRVYAISAPFSERPEDAIDVASEPPADVRAAESCPALTATVLRARSLPAPELHSDSDDPGWVYEYWTLRSPVESFVAPEPLDLIWIADRYHALHGTAFGSVSPVRVGAALLAALKPGGILIVADYAAKPGTGIRDAAALHRVDPEQVKREMAAAGFELAGESDVLRNRGDRRRGNAHSIDGADRFLLEFRKP